MTSTGLPAGGFGVGTYAAHGRAFPGLVLAEGQVIDLSDHFADTHALFDDWEKSLPLLRQIADAAPTATFVFDQVRALPPVSHPNILQAGANYKTHVVQMMTHTGLDDKEGELDAARTERTQNWVDHRAETGKPFIFSGLASAMCGAGDEIILPAIGEKHDWELELAVVIGKSGRHVSRDAAMDLVAGYTIANDLGTLDLAKRTDAGPYTIDLLTKNQPTFLPVGPFVVPKEFVPDVAPLRIELSVNGEIRQHETTGDMIFDIPSLISFASSLVKLLPGDILLTGSPAGNGGYWNRYLQAGDVIDSSITSLGRQRNVCVAEVHSSLTAV